MGIFDGNRRGPGIHITWIIGLVIAGFGLLRYFTATQTNPVTGKSERVSLTPQQEVALGARTAPQMAAQMGGEVPRSDPRAALVAEVGQNLVRQINVPNMPWQFDFHLLDDPKTVNAFALPGGQIFITTALLSRLENEAQLAGVLGHEIGHVIERHAAERMAKQQLGQSLVNAVAIGASGDHGGYTAAQVAQMANQFVQLKYGREDELQSDGYGVNYMTQAGFDPTEMIHVMEILKKASGGSSQPEFMSTHPDPGNRAEQIRGQIKQHFPSGVPNNLTKGRPLESPAATGGGRGKALPPKEPF